MNLVPVFFTKASSIVIAQFPLLLVEQEGYDVVDYVVMKLFLCIMGHKKFSLSLLHYVVYVITLTFTPAVLDPAVFIPAVKNLNVVPFDIAFVITTFNITGILLVLEPFHNVHLILEALIVVTP